MIRLLYLFMMFSVVGWLWETPWVSLRTKKFINRGFLRGPYIPIYGCAVVTIIFTMGIFANADQNSIFIILLEIIYMALITAAWEFVTSWGLEKIFKTRWWDYSTHKFNIQGRISLYVTVFFGLGGFTLYRFVLPVFDNILDQFASNQITVILSLFYLVFLVDSVITLMDLFKTKNIIVQIERLSKELSLKAEQNYKEFTTKTQKSRAEFTDYLTEIKNNLQERIDSTPAKKVTNKIKAEINKLTETINASRRINRFYRKYPNSKSFILFTVIKTIEDIQQRTNGKRD